MQNAKAVIKVSAQILKEVLGGRQDDEVIVCGRPEGMELRVEPKL